MPRRKNRLRKKTNSKKQTFGFSQVALAYSVQVGEKIADGWDRMREKNLGVKTRWFKTDRAPITMKVIERVENFSLRKKKFRR
jgi:hypothetical protein